MIGQRVIIFGDVAKRVVGVGTRRSTREKVRFFLSRGKRRASLTRTALLLASAPATCDSSNGINCPVPRSLIRPPAFCNIATMS